MLLQVKDIQVSYEGIKAIRSLSLEVEEGAIVAVLGANGAGKSTLLRTISGLKVPTTGEIWFEGERIDRKPPDQIFGMGIAQVPEARRLFPKMTVWENLLIGGNLIKDKKLLNDGIELSFHYFQVLRERKYQRAGTLSGGEQQMLAVARALVSKPRLILFDEPSLGLSPMLVFGLFEIVKKINEDGVTSILAEQNAAKALELAETAYVLENGLVKLSGPVDLIRDDKSIKDAYFGV